MNNNVIKNQIKCLKKGIASLYHGVKMSHIEKMFKDDMFLGLLMMNKY